VLTFQGVWGSAHRYTASQPIRLYSFGGGIGLISAIIERSSNTGSATVYVTLSGHLVDLP
jgi:NADH:ubiquinone oxidoreductase subunit 4 (subunit M)